MPREIVQQQMLVLERKNLQANNQALETTKGKNKICQNKERK